MKPRDPKHDQQEPKEKRTKKIEIEHTETAFSFLAHQTFLDPADAFRFSSVCLFSSNPKSHQPSIRSMMVFRFDWTLASRGLSGLRGAGETGDSSSGMGGGGRMMRGSPSTGRGASSTLTRFLLSRMGAAVGGGGGGGYGEDDDDDDGDNDDDGFAGGGGGGGDICRGGARGSG
jgi:hypothetical protein